jgi:hypothetical protein
MFYVNYRIAGDSRIRQTKCRTDAAMQTYVQGARWLWDWFEQGVKA